MEFLTVTPAAAVGLGSEGTPRVDPRVPCGVSARRKKTEANRADRPTGALRVAGPPPQAGRSYAAWRVGQSARGTPPPWTGRGALQDGQLVP
jgi:hypothetical protein